jgi:hypothetical protein
VPSALKAMVLCVGLMPNEGSSSSSSLLLLHDEKLTIAEAIIRVQNILFATLRAFAQFLIFFVILLFIY